MILEKLEKQKSTCHRVLNCDRMIPRSPLLHWDYPQYCLVKSSQGFSQAASRLDSCLNKTVLGLARIVQGGSALEARRRGNISTGREFLNSKSKTPAWFPIQAFFRKKHPSRSRRQHAMFSKHPPLSRLAGGLALCLALAILLTTWAAPRLSPCPAQGAHLFPRGRKRSPMARPQRPTSCPRSTRAA